MLEHSQVHNDLAAVIGMVLLISHVVSVELSSVVVTVQSALQSPICFRSFVVV